MQRITNCLWFDRQAEEAANYYVSVFPNSRILHVARYGGSGAKASGQPPGSVMTVTFELDREQFMALNGGPVFEFSPAISLMIHCETQGEVDHFWSKLSEGGREEQCGWLTDRYGVSWQVVPAILGEVMTGTDRRRSEKVMAALLTMKKPDIGALQKAAGE